MPNIMRLSIVDCQGAGIAGDMFLGALLDLGADSNKVFTAIESLRDYIDGCNNIIKNFSPYILIEFHDIDLSDIERKNKWNKIINNSQKITYVDGDSEKYQYGDEVISYPNCDRFHVLIKY